jgi:hypothetical protein
MPEQRRAIWTPAWSNLRSIGNSYSVRLTVLIPLVGYLIIFNADLVRYLHLAKDFVGLETQSETSVSPRLLLIYFGLTLIALGSAIYSVACPWQVKNYGTSAAYVGGERPNLGDFAMEVIENTLRNSQYQQRYRYIRDRYEHVPGPPITPEEKTEIDKAVLHLYFEYLNLSYPPPRWLAFVAFVIGFICLLIPSIKVFFTVCLILAGLVF